MKPRRTVASNQVFVLGGGNEDNDLWVTLTTDVEENPVICSTWVPNDSEREAIAAGANIELVVWGTGHPPVAMRIGQDELKRKDAPDEHQPVV